MNVCPIQRKIVNSASTPVDFQLTMIQNRNKAGYTAQDAPSMRTFHLQKKKHGTDGPADGPTDGRTGTISYRDATAHLKRKRYPEFQRRMKTTIKQKVFGFNILLKTRHRHSERHLEDY